MTTQTNTANPSSNRRTQRLTILGATSGVGRQLALLALDAGHHVTALVRDPTRMDICHDRLMVVSGDANDYAAVLAVVRGSDAVLCALGAPAFSSSKVRSQGTEHIVRAMQQTGVRRLICLSVYGAGDSREGLPFFLRYFLFPLYLRRPVAEHEIQESIIRQSEVDWTIVRPPFLTDGPLTGTYSHGFANDQEGLTLDISRADVAEFMLRQLDDRGYARHAVGISYARSAA
jgi:putative NADH-flavin reductase